MKKNKMLAFSAIASTLCLVVPLTANVISAEEPTDIVPEGGLSIRNYRGGNTFSRKVSTAIDVYSKKGTIPKVKYDTIKFNGVNVNVMEVKPDGENTLLQLEYAFGKPMYMNEFYDGSLTKDDKYYLVGGINGGFFNNNSLSADYGVPSGAVASNWKYINWSNGWTLTPAYGNGFTTAYFDNENPMSIQYHGWNHGEWYPENDAILEYIENGIRYNLPTQYGLSGAYALVIDGLPNNLAKDDNVYFNYNGGKSAVTLFGQKEDGTYLLVTTEGGIGNGDQETKLMQQLGAHNAYRLDGGGSSQMMYENGLINYHEVTLSNMDGTPSYVKAVKDGSLLEDVADPERQYYAFQGWYDDKESAANLSEEHKVDLSTYTFEDDTKLYAGWLRNRVKVTLNIDGQSFGEETFDQGNLYTPISAPNADNGWLGNKDKFVGWFIDPECTIPYIDTELFEGETLTLYGKVERYVPKQYNISINANKGGNVTPNDGTKINEGEEFVLTVLCDPNFVIESVTVNGQQKQLDDNNQLKITNVQSDMKIDVKFKQVKINAIVKDANGTELFNKEVDFGFKIKVVDENGQFVAEYQFDENNTSVVLETPIKNDRPFSHWNVDHNGDEVIIKPVYGEVYKFAVIGNVKGNGAIEGLGNYGYGSDVTLTFVPDQNYEIGSVTLDGELKGKVSSLTIDDINKEHVVDVEFVPTIFEEGTVNIRFVDNNKLNAQDLGGYNETIKVVDDGTTVPVDISQKVRMLESANYKIISNNVPERVSFENDGQAFTVVVDHNELVESAPDDDTITRTVVISYVDGNNQRSETIKQDGKKHYANSRVTDLVTNQLIADFDITYSFDALRMPEKEGYTLDVKEIPAVDNATSYTDSFKVIYTKNNIQKHKVEVVFVDINNVDTFDMSGYNQKLNVDNGTVLNINKFIKSVEDRGFVISNDVAREFTVDGDKYIKINVVHGTSVTEELKTYTFTRTIHYAFDDDKAKDYDTVQKTELNRKVISTKDNVTKKVTSKYEDTWNDTYLMPSVTTPKVDGYTADKGFVNSLDLRSVNPEKDSTKYEVTVKYTKDKVEPEKGEGGKPTDSPKPTVKPSEKPNSPSAKPTNKPTNGANGDEVNSSDKINGSNKVDKPNMKPNESARPNDMVVEDDLMDPEITAVPETTVEPTLIPLEDGETQNNGNKLWRIVGVAIAGITAIGLMFFFAKKDSEEKVEDSDLIVDDEDNESLDSIVETIENDDHKDTNSDDIND